MIQTSYVPLEHPYRIISYNGTLGIQIGTLIVTREKESMDGDYAIETHSHPVVSYVNNKKTTKAEPPAIFVVYEPVEGVVWDKVEVGQVRTLMRENEELEWENLMDYFRDCKLLELRNPKLSSSIELFDTLSRLVDWGVTIKYPKVKRDKVLLLNVELYDFVIGAKAYCLGSGDLGIVTASVNVEKMVHSIIRQVVTYRLLLKNYLSFDKLVVLFSTKENRYKPLAEKLNDISDYDYYLYSCLSDLQKMSISAITKKANKNYIAEDDEKPVLAAEENKEPEKD